MSCGNLKDVFESYVRHKGTGPKGSSHANGGGTDSPPPRPACRASRVVSVQSDWSSCRSRGTTRPRHAHIRRAAAQFCTSSSYAVWVCGTQRANNSAAAAAAAAAGGRRARGGSRRAHHRVEATEAVPGSAAPGGVSVRIEAIGIAHGGGAPGTAVYTPAGRVEAELSICSQP